MDQLPTELLTYIGKLSASQDLAVLARLNHHLNKIFTPILYRRNITEHDPRDSCLLWAAEVGVLGTLKQAFAFGADLNVDGSKDEDFCPTDPQTSRIATPLHLATEHGHHEMVQWLLDNGASLDVPSQAYCFCVFRGHGTRYSEDWFPLHTAICHSDEAMVKLLLDRGARLAAKDYPGLHDAAAQGLVAVVDLFLEQPDFDPLQRTSMETTPLHHVSNCFDSAAGVEIVHKLASRGVPVNEVSSDGTALYLAVYHQMFEVAQALMDCGAVPLDPPEVRQGLSILHQCVMPWNPSLSGEPNEKATYDMMSRLVSTGIDLEIQSGTCRRFTDATVLYFAAADLRSPALVRMLLEAGACADAPVTGFQLLKTRSILDAILRGLKLEIYLREWEPDKSFLDIIRLLLEYGARIDSTDGVEESALEYTCNISERGSSSLLKLLCENATAANVELGHVESLEERYGEESENPHLRKLVERLKGV